MNYDNFLRFIFPDGMFDYFEMVGFNELSDKVESILRRKILFLKNMIMISLRAKGSMKKFVCMIIPCVDVVVFSI